MDRKHSARLHERYKKRKAKAKTNKLIDRLTFNPQKQLSNCWNEDIFFLITQEAKKLKAEGFIILAMGDFNTRVGALKGLEENTPDTNRNSPMFFNFLQETNLLIINTLYTCIFLAILKSLLVLMPIEFDRLK